MKAVELIVGQIKFFTNYSPWQYAFCYLVYSRLDKPPSCMAAAKAVDQRDKGRITYRLSTDYLALFYGVVWYYFGLWLRIC
jgi:hypothetical protein